MKILNIVENTYDGIGRYVKAVNHEFNCIDGVSSTISCESNNKLNLKNVLHKLIYRLFRFIFLNKIHEYDFNFTNFLSGNFNFKKLDKKYDVVIIWSKHRHLSESEFRKILQKYCKKIIIFPLDYEMLTGGCHFTWGCENFNNSCTNCPQVNFRYKNFPNQTFRNRWKLYSEIEPQFIASTTEIKKNIELCINNNYALKSTKNTVKFLPLGVKLSDLNKYSKFESFEKLNLEHNDDYNYLMMVNFNLSDERKGGRLINDFLCIFSEKLKSKENLNIKLLIIGGGVVNSLSDNTLNCIANVIDIFELGVVDEDKLNCAFCISKVLISLSIEDVGPLVVSQALAAGVVPIGFNIGIFRDIQHESYEYPICGDVDALADDLMLILEGKFNENIKYLPPDLNLFCRNLLEISCHHSQL